MFSKGRAGVSRPPGLGQTSESSEAAEEAEAEPGGALRAAVYPPPGTAWPCSSRRHPRSPCSAHLPDKAVPGHSRLPQVQAWGALGPSPPVRPSTCRLSASPSQMLGWQVGRQAVPSPTSPQDRASGLGAPPMGPCLHLSSSAGLFFRGAGEWDCSSLPPHNLLCVHQNPLQRGVLPGPPHRDVLSPLCPFILGLTRAI